MAKVLLICILLSSPAFAALPPTQIYDEGTKKGVFFNLDCVGGGIACTQAGIVGTITSPPAAGMPTDLIPSIDNTYNIGEDSTPLEWRSLYVDSVAYIDGFGQNLMPSVHNSFDIGSSVTEWKDLHLDGSAYIDDFAQDILPNSTDAYDIGSSTARFKDIYAETITIDRIIGAGVTESDTLDTVAERGSTTDVSLTTTATITAEQLTSTDAATIAGALTSNTYTDGFMTIGSGNIADAIGGTFSGVVLAEHIESTDDLHIADELQINGTMVISSGSISDSTGTLSLGTSNVTIGGDLSVAGNINLTGISTGHIKPSTDNVYELGGEDKRYTRVAALSVRFDPDTYMKFDGNFINIFVNGELVKRFGSAPTIENVVYGGENVIYSAEQVVY